MRRYLQNALRMHSFQEDSAMAIPAGPNLTTSPAASGEVGARQATFVAAAAVTSGVATKLWLELTPYPPGNPRLWLFVNGQWVYQSSPSAVNVSSVQSAFCQCPDKMEVAVWYSGGVIVGLVVRSK
jgi:hypothetical protein